MKELRDELARFWGKVGQSSSGLSSGISLLCDRKTIKEGLIWIIY